MTMPVDADGRVLKPGDRVVLRGTVERAPDRHGIFVRPDRQDDTLHWCRPYIFEVEDDAPRKAE